MTREHDAIRELLAPVALGAAEPAEVERVEAHVAECAVCLEELAGLSAASGVLALAVPPVDPPPALRESIMARVRATAGSIRPWPAVAVVAVIAAILLGWNIVLQTSDEGGREDVAALSVTGSADAPSISGRVVYVPGEDTAVMRLNGLPPLKEGDAYQLWVLRGGMPESAGLFQPTGPAQAVRVADNLAGADALAVTAQPRTSRTAPEGPILVTAPLSG